MEADEPDLHVQVEAWRAWEAEDKARRWLTANLRHARFYQLSDAEMVFELRAIASHDDPVSLLDVLCDRVERKSRRFQTRVARELGLLSADHPGPGRDAVAVDRAMMRLLHRLPDTIGRPIAIASLKSSRQYRRSAAWKFYRRHGLDDESRNVLEAEFPGETHEEYHKLVADDAELVLRLGPDAVLRIAPNRYWRSKVIEAMLSNGDQCDDLRALQPAEWLWAVSRRHDEEFLPAVLALLSENQANVDLVNRALLCLIEFQNRSAIDIAIKAGRTVLDRPALPLPETL